MEENSEACLRTEVSSTTADVSDMQEVTASHGNLEMVIIVEKMEEEANSQPVKSVASSSSQNDNNSNDNKSTQSPKKSTQIDTTQENTKHTQNDPKSPKVVPIIVKKPIKIIRPAKPNQITPMIQEQQDSNTILPAIISEQTDILNESSDNQSNQNIEPLQSTEIQSPTEEISKIRVEKIPITENLDDTDIAKTPNQDKTIPNDILKSNVTNDINQSVEKSPSKVAVITGTNENSPIKKSLDENSKKSIKSNDQSIGSTVTSTNNMTEKLNLEVRTENNDVIDTVPKPAIDILHEKEASNDSQNETGSETSEKEHNKSISRELKSLIDSAKESKIISECRQLTSKTRKSRVNMDTSNTSLNNSIEAEKIQGVRRGSCNSQKSNCSEKSEKAMKRSMRSQNPEFVHKVKQFLNSVTGRVQKPEPDTILSDEEFEEIKKNNQEPLSSTPKRKKILMEPLSGGKLKCDAYCWRCHWAVEQSANEKTHAPMQCTVCPRSYHYKCLTVTERTKITSEKSWVCPECITVLSAESSETRSPAMKRLSLGVLCDLLKHALTRMMDLNGVEPFTHPVDRTAFPDYDSYVVHPMDLSMMKENISLGQYGSTEAFLADAQWILHNSIIFNTCEMQSKLTGVARALIRSCRTEMGEIEACPECYAAAYAHKPTWFTNVCSVPHILLWAKLKGFPYWPAKGMSVSSVGHVDVRFFGAHDRAWVPARDCFLYSEKDPNNFRTKRQDIIDSMLEAEDHIRNISRKYGKFVYPPFKTQFDPSKLNEQIKMMIPSFEGEIVQPSIKEKSSPVNLKAKSRSNSKGSKDSVNDGDISEGEETLPTSTHTKLITYNIEDDNEEMDIDVEKLHTRGVARSQSKENVTRKRRHSELEDVITVSNIGSKDKRKRTEGEEKEVKLENKTDLDKNNKNVNNKENEKSAQLKEAVVTIMENSNINKFITTIANESVNKEKHDLIVGEKSNTEEKASKCEENNSQPTEKEMVVEDNNSSPRITLSVQQDKNKATTIKIISTVETPESKQTCKDKDTPKTKVISTSKERDKSQRQKPLRREKSSSNEKDKSTNQVESVKKSRRSTSTKSKTDNSSHKKNESSSENSNSKDKATDSVMHKNISVDVIMDKSTTDKKTSTPKASSSKHTKSSKDRTQFDDNLSLATIAKEVAKNNVIVNNVPGLPTITNVHSLSSNTQSSTTKTATKSVEITVEANCDSSIFTPTSTDNVRNMKEAINKLQKLKGNPEPSMVGRVGVRAFARMTSPEKPTPSKNNDINMQVEIKAEPVDYDDPERQQQIAFVKKAFSLQPVNVTSSTSLRDVRISKVAPAANTNTRKTASKAPENRSRAKKTFPQPRKPDEGRSELNSKNSMVYIPIQPPMTQAPIRAVRPVSVTNGPMTSSATRPSVTIINSTANNMTTNTTHTGTLPFIASTKSNPVTTANPSSVINSVSSGHTVSQVPTTVHTMPLITSVNGQWTFSLQPVLSVGADGVSSSPAVNGLPERGGAGPTLALMPAGGPPPAGTPALASLRPADNVPGEPPQLQQRPSLMNPLDPNAPTGGIPTPSTVGPLTAKLNQNAVKLTDFFRTLLEDSLELVDEPVAQVTTMKLQLEQMRWQHQNEIAELKHNHELMLSEMRTSFEKEKARAVNDVRRAGQLEMATAVKLAKSKQWCANCGQEAQFYCCWNTSYCDYPCQRTHWQQHYSMCTQQRAQGSNSSSNGEGNVPENRLQPAPDNLPKSTAAPALTVGGKPVTSRAILNYDQAHKSSIIVSMVDDSSGNQTMKCVGTYKSSGAVQPLILNKQLMISEESTPKKVVTSGGYLIVGAAANTSASTAAPLVTSSPRPHTVQYYS